MSIAGSCMEDLLEDVGEEVEQQDPRYIFADAVVSGATSERMTRGVICKRHSDVLEE